MKVNRLAAEVGAAAVVVVAAVLLISLLISDGDQGRGSTSASPPEATSSSGSSGSAQLSQAESPGSSREATNEKGNGWFLAVLSDGGGTLPGASIQDSDTWNLLGATEEDGTWSPKQAPPLGRYLVTAKNHSREFFEVRENRAREEVVLRKAWAVTGKVVGPTGHPVDGKVRVIALAGRDSLTTSAVASSLAGLGPLPTTTADANGDFVIDGLDAGEAYRLFAGGGGYIAANHFAQPVRPADGQHVLVEVRPVYGVRILLREEDGGKLALSEQLNGKWHGTPSTPPGAKIIVSGGWTAALLGLGPQESRSAFDKTYYFQNKVEAPEGLPLSYSAHLPGYEEVDVKITAMRAAADLEDIELRLTRVGDGGFGRITVWLDPPEAVEVVLPSGDNHRRSQLYLTEQDGGRLIRAQLVGLENGFVDIEGLPHGDYWARFRAPHQLFREPSGDLPGRLVVVADEPVDFRVGVDQLGSLSFTLQDSAGQRYVGPVQGTHIRTFGGEADSFFIAFPPYEIPLLPPGEYKLVVPIPSKDVPLESAFTIMAGEVTELELRPR
ncbi:MAG: carboxypeptidase-like regulatory domain-containing protein [Planctomycetota bacterium]|nr:carboxypeptidase-like regulatory domain-containing protein [Planctomycetota bacterium]